MSALTRSVSTPRLSQVSPGRGRYFANVMGTCSIISQAASPGPGRLTLDSVAGAPPLDTDK